MTNEVNVLAASCRTSSRNFLHSFGVLAVMLSAIFPGPVRAQLTVVYSFPLVSGHYVSGANPQSNLVEVSPGVFLTTASVGGGTATSCLGFASLKGCGTIIRIDTTVVPATGTVVHQFTGTDGATPTGQLTLASDGNVYGVTQNGGVNSSCTLQFSCGTVYRIAPDGSGFLTVHNFGGPGASKDGQAPTAGIIQGTDGNLYGSTGAGGEINNHGTIFKIAPPFDASAAYNAYAFAASSSVAGGGPQLPVQATDGKLYGLSTTGIKVMYVFDPIVAGVPATEVSTPDFGLGGLVETTGGVFYGVSRNGGSHVMGSLFQATTTPPSATTLHSFGGGTADGAFPQAELYLASDGILYGTTFGGGNPLCAGCGAVFNLLPGTSGKTSLLDFFDNTQGGRPQAQLTEGSDNFLYGTAFGYSSPGSVFRHTKYSLSVGDSQLGAIGMLDGATAVAGDTSSTNVYVAGSAAGLPGGTGNGGFYIARFTPDGSLDTNFNHTGFIQFGPGLNTDYIARIRVDKYGNIYVAGHTSGALFGHTSQGGQDGWVAKFAAKTTGKPAWVYMFGTPQDDLVYDFTLDAGGGIYISGATKGGLVGTLKGVQDAYVAQLTAKFNQTTHHYDFTFTPFQWGKLGETRRARSLAYCATAGRRQVYAAGYDDASGNAWLSLFNAPSLTSGLLKTQTLRGGSGPGFFEAHGVGADRACNVYLGGHNISHPLPSITHEHFFLNKYSKELKTKIWEVDGPLNSGNSLAPEDFIYDLMVDPSNRVFVGGSTTSPILFGDQNNGETAPWYAAYDGTGKRLRSSMVQFTPGPSVVTEGNGIFANSVGVYMVGNTNGNVAGPPDPAFSDLYLYVFVPLP